MLNLLPNLRRTAALITHNALLDSLVYPLRKAWAEASWTMDGYRRRGPQRIGHFWHALTGRHLPWPDEWTASGPVRMIHPTDRGAIAETDEGAIEIAFAAPDLVRVRYSPDGIKHGESSFSYGVAKPVATWPEVAFVSIQHDGAYLLQTEALVVGLQLATAQLVFATPDGVLLRADMGFEHGDGAVRHRVAMAEEEQLYGLGERTTDWNRRGRTHVLWNADPAVYSPGDDPIDLNIPAYVGVVPQDDDTAHTYLVFYDNPYYSEFDLGDGHPAVAEHRFVDGDLTYYLAAGPLPRLMERYTELTGRPTLQPLWMLGYQQSRWSYETEDRVRKLADDFAAHQVPCDAIYLDIHYMDGYRCFTVDEERFPNLHEMAADLRARGIKLVSIIDPGIKRDPNYDVYRDGKAKGRFCTMPDGRVFHAPVWPGNSAFPDFTDPDARAWWGTWYERLIDAGIEGFWNDMNEPSAFANRGDRTLPQTLHHHMEGRGGTHREAHNVYGMLMVRATQEGLKALRPDTRPVVITRAGWAGVQRYATSWTADNESTWPSYRLTIPMVMALGLSGLGFTGPDIGGFAGTPSGELFTRWIQMGAFMPFFRAHTARGDPDQEPWSYGEPYLSIVRRFIELRYELLPYLYTALWQMTQRGWPMVRPPAWMAPEMTALWDVDDAFMCGDSLLVAPAMRRHTSTRDVVLPPGVWYDFWTNRRHDGDRTVELFAPLESMPLLVREGTVLPMGEIGASVEQRKDKFLRLSVYPRTTVGTSTSELYEDAGMGVAYRAGEYRTSQFEIERTATELMITWEQEGDYTPPYEHVELTLNGLDRAPEAIDVDGDRYSVVTVDPVRRTVLLGIPPFRVLRIKL